MARYGSNRHPRGKRPRPAKSRIPRDLMIPDLTSITSRGAKADPKEVAAKVQGMFMEVMLKAMEDSVGAEDGLFGKSATSDIYRGMLREQMAAAMGSQMKSPLEDQLGTALTHTQKTEDLPVKGRISSAQGWRND